MKTDESKTDADLVLEFREQRRRDREQRELNEIADAVARVARNNRMNPDAGVIGVQIAKIRRRGER